MKANTCNRCFLPPPDHELWCQSSPDGLDLGRLEEEVKRLIVLEEIGLNKPIVANFGGQYRRFTGMRVEFYRGQFVVVLDT